MPRFEKGSQEAKDYMEKIRNARKQPGYVPPANKKLTKKQKESEALKKVKVDIPIMGETSLIVPEYFAIRTKNGYKIVSPMSQERNLSSRQGVKSLKIVRKPIGDMALVREDGSEEPLPILAFSKKDQTLIQNHFKVVEQFKDREPQDIPTNKYAKPKERGRPTKLQKNIEVHKERNTKPGFSKKKPKKTKKSESENIQMTMEEEPAAAAAAAAPTAAYQRKQRQVYATEEERTEAIKKQKRDYAQRKRDAVKAAKGSGIVDDIKKGIQTGYKKTSEYLGAVVKGRGNLYPPKVRSILKKVGDQKVTAAELRRTPVQSLLTKAMDLFTFGQFSKNMSKTPYDKLFHLQIILTLGSGLKLLVEKNEVINMNIGSPSLTKGTEVLQITPFTGVVLNDALEKTKSKMGENNYYDYNAEKNNCQDFIAALMTANGWGNADDFAFVKQDTKTLFKGLSGLSKTAYTLTELGERANVAMTGKGLESIQDRIDAKKSERDMLMSLYHKSSEELDELYEEAMMSEGSIDECECESDMEGDSETGDMEGEGLKSFKSGSFGSDYVVQSVLFKKSKYSLPEAKKWLKDNKYKSPKVDETENMLRFRQLSPDVVDAKGYTEYHNKPLGLSGIELVIAYRRKKEERLKMNFKKRLGSRIKGGSNGRPQPDQGGFGEDEDPNEQINLEFAANVPEDVVGVMLSFLPNIQRFAATNRMIGFATRYELMQQLQRLETSLEGASGDPQRRRRLLAAIIALRRRLRLPPIEIEPIKNLKRPPREDDDDDGGAPGVRRILFA